VDHHLRHVDPGRFVFYAPVIDKGDYVTGAGDDAKTLIAIGALLELLLIISNVGTAVVPYRPTSGRAKLVRLRS
jgi:hypothetical protein